MDGPVPFRQLPYNLKTSPASSVVGVFVDVTPGLLSACGNFASASVPPVASRALTRRPQRGSVPSVWKALRPGRHGGRQCSRPHRARIETRIFEGATTRFYLSVESEDGALELKADWPSRDVATLAAGDYVHVGVDPADVHVFPAAARPAP